MDSLSFMAWTKAALITLSEDMPIRRSQSQSLCSSRMLSLSLPKEFSLNCTYSSPLKSPFILYSSSLSVNVNSLEIAY